MKTTLPMRNELLVLGVLRGNPDIWFNELKKKTGLRPNTLTNVLKRLQDDNRISMKKQGIKSLYSSTDKGLIFLNKATRKQATYLLNNNWIEVRRSLLKILYGRRNF